MVGCFMIGCFDLASNLKFYLIQAAGKCLHFILVLLSTLVEVVKCCLIHDGICWSNKASLKPVQQRLVS